MAQEDFIIELLKRIQADVTGSRRPTESLELRMAAIDDYQRGVKTSVAGVHSDLQQLNARVDRIERRLDLVCV